MAAAPKDALGATADEARGRGRTRGFCPRLHQVRSAGPLGPGRWVRSRPLGACGAGAGRSPAPAAVVTSVVATRGHSRAGTGRVPAVAVGARLDHSSRQSDHSPVRSCPFCAEEIQDAAVVCRWCGRDLPDPFAISTEPDAVILYMGRRYGIGRSRNPPATCLWDLRDRSAPPVKLWPDDEAGWQAGWGAFTRKESKWIDTRHPPTCPGCGSQSVAFISREEAILNWNAWGVGRAGRTFACQSCQFRW